MVWSEFNLESSGDESETDFNRHVAESVDAVIKRCTRPQQPQRRKSKRTPQSAKSISYLTNRAANKSVNKVVINLKEAEAKSRRVAAVVESVLKKSTPKSRRVEKSVHPLELTGSAGQSAQDAGLDFGQRHPPEETEPADSSSVSLPAETTDAYPESGWTSDERQRLLDALKIHGAQDIERLQSAVKTRSAMEILQFLNSRHGARVTCHSSSKSCPDSKLEEWQEIADYLLSNRREFSVPTVKKILQEKFWDEERKMQDRGPTSWSQNLNFSRIYLHLINAIDGKQTVSLTAHEKRLVQFLIYDLGNCVRSISSMHDKQEYFGNILSAYRRNSLMCQRTSNARASNFSADALCSLNPFCVPNSMLLELPTQSGGGGENAGGNATLQEDSTIDTDDGYQTVSSSANDNSTVTDVGGLPMEQ